MSASRTSKDKACQEPPLEANAQTLKGLAMVLRQPSTSSTKVDPLLFLTLFSRAVRFCQQFSGAWRAAVTTCAAEATPSTRSDVKLEPL